METKNPQFRHTLNYGLIIGGVIAIYQVLLYVLGVANNKPLGNVAFFLLVIGLYVSVKHFKEDFGGGFINFGLAFKVAFLTCIFSSVIGAIYTYFQYKYMAPQLVTELMELSQESLMQRGIPDDQVELQTMILQKMMTPGILALLYIVGMAFWGSLLALVTAAVLKKTDNPLLHE
jgi:hypothetical protein